MRNWKIQNNYNIYFSAYVALVSATIAAAEYMYRCADIFAAGEFLIYVKSIDLWSLQWPFCRTSAFFRSSHLCTVARGSSGQVSYLFLNFLFSKLQYPRRIAKWLHFRSEHSPFIDCALLRRLPCCASGSLRPAGAWNCRAGWGHD